MVARCGARRPAIATMHVRGRKAEYTQQRYVNRLIRLKFSTVHVMASRVVYRFCLWLVRVMGYTPGRLWTNNIMINNKYLILF